MALTKITTSVIAANTLGTANIADNSIDATKIAANSILTRHIDDDQITGDQLADDITIAGNLTVSGNLVTNGATVTNSSTNTTIEDNLIELGTGTTGAPSSDSGIVIERGDSDNAFIGWDESEDKFILGTGSFTGASTGNLTITTAPLVVGALTTSGLSFPTSDGTNGQVLKTDGSGSLTFGDNTTKVDNYTATGDGSTTAFDTGINPGSEVNTWIFIDGVYQQKSEYSYSGSTVTFTTAPQNGASIDVITGTSSNITASDTVLGVYEATTTNTDTYATGISASNENNTWVFVGGVYQPKDSYTFSSGTLTFDANTPTGQKLSVVATKTITAGAVDTSTLAANAVTSAKIASNSILSRHIANNSIVGADISATTQITASTFTGALTGDVTGNVVGNLTGTIQTAAQTNITSVGTLSALTVSGQLTAGGLSYPTSDGTNEQVLRTDGSGNLSFGTVSGTTINNNTNNYVMTGTGTANTLNGESGLIFDGTNLGIGTSSPDGKLDIQTSGIGSGILLDAIGSGNDIELTFNRWTGTGSDFHQWRVGAEVNNLTFGYVQGAKGSTPSEKMRIDSSGNVGIGTTSPDNSLHVYHATTNRLALIESGDADALIEFKDNSTSNPPAIGATGDNFVIRTGSSNAERTRVDSSGNLLVGKTSTALVDVGHNFNPSGFSFHTRDGGAVAYFNRETSDGEIVNFYKDGSTVGSIGTSSDQMYIGHSDTGIRFTATADDIRPWNPSTGAIRDAAIDLGDSVGRFKDLYLSGTLTNDGTGGISIDTTGNVGIGTTSPVTTLHVQQSAVTSSPTRYSALYLENNGNCEIQFVGNSANDCQLRFGTSNNTFKGAVEYKLDVDALLAYTNSTERMRIDSAGNVGIGKIPNRSRKLEVAGDINLDNGYGLEWEDGGVGIVGSGATDTMTFATAGAERMRIDSSGNLLIGTTTTSSASSETGLILGDGFMTCRSSDQAGIFRRTSSNGIIFIFRNTANARVGTIETSASSTSYNTTSDYRLKENVDYTWDATTRLKQLKPARFNFIEDETNTVVDGFLAHEVSDIVPEAISGEKDAVDEDGNPDYQGIDQAKLVPLLTKALQEQQIIIDDLKSRIEALEE